MSRGNCLAALAASFVALGLMALPAHADDYYVSTTGDDDNPGTIDEPFLTVERGEDAASAGDTVFIRGGVYSFSGTSDTIGVELTKSGAQDNPIHYFAFEGETPTFDLFALTPQARVTGIDVHASFLHIRGLEVRGVQQVIVGDSWSVRVRGDHNILEQLNVHDGEAPGVFIASGADNLILNCDSHHNYDPLEDGGNGDGFGCHSTGGGNVLRGCRGYENSDDGFDFINAPGTCTVESSWAFRNGYVPDTMTGAGNGAGFKAGGFGSPPNIPNTGVPRHVIRFNVAFGNRSQGFYANHHPGGLDFIHNTAFGNGTNFDMLVEGGASTHVLHNNLALSPGTAIARFTGGMDSSNSWTLPITVSADDFSSVDEGEALMPRKADGSLPDVSFMHLVAGSDLIDQGEDVGFPFNDAAPDLGAYESGPPLAGEEIDAGVVMGTAGVGVAGTGVAGTGAAGTGAAGTGAAGTGAAGGLATGGASGATAGTTSDGTAGTSTGGAGGALGTPMAGASALDAPVARRKAPGGCSVALGVSSAPQACLPLLALVALRCRRRVRP